MTGRAGTSALAMYRSLRNRRRRRAAAVAVLLVAAAGASRLSVPEAVVLTFGGAALFLVVVELASPRQRDIARWRRGAEGEWKTSQVLGALASRRWTVWHDLRVPGSRANIDHVVLGRTGVWVVDTKSTRAEVTTGWRWVRFGDRRLDTSGARWEADVVAELVEARLAPAAGPGRAGRIPVRPLVALHCREPVGGRGLKARGVRVGGVRVVPADQLLRRIQKGRRRVRRADLPAVRRALQDAFRDRSHR